MIKRAALIIIIVLVFLTGCSNSQNNKTINALDIYNYILVDDNVALSNSLKEGFPINYKNRDSISLLDYAVMKDSLKSIDLLLSEGADYEKNNTIFKVKSIKALTFFIENGANLNIVNEVGDPLLIDYIKKKPTKYSLFLIEKGADIKARDSNGWNSLFWASMTGDKRILDSILKKGGLPLTKDSKGNYPIYYASDEDKINSLLKFNYNINEVNSDNENILGEVYLKVVANNHPNIILQLYKKGVNPNYNSYGKGALDIATEANNEKMIEFLKSNSVKE